MIFIEFISAFREFPKIHKNERSWVTSVQEPGYFSWVFIFKSRLSTRILNFYSLLPFVQLEKKERWRVDTAYHKMRPNYSYSFFLASLPTKLTVTSVLPASNWRLMGRVLQYSIVGYCMCVSMEVKINYSIVTRERVQAAWQLWRLSDLGKICGSAFTVSSTLS